MNSNNNSPLVGTRRTRLARDQVAAGTGVGQESGNSD
jgi:hypothetical protein